VHDAKQGVVVTLSRHKAASRSSSPR
jgi:hypothetical protein